MEENDYASDFETFSERTELTPAPPPPPPPPLSLSTSLIKKQPKQISKNSSRPTYLLNKQRKSTLPKVKESKNQSVSLPPELREHFIDRIRILEDIIHEQKLKIKQLTEENRILSTIQKRQEKAFTKKEREESQWHSIIEYLTREVHSLRLQHQHHSSPNAVHSPKHKNVEKRSGNEVEVEKNASDNCTKRISNESEILPKKEPQSSVPKTPTTIHPSILKEEKVHEAQKRETLEETKAFNGKLTPQPKPPKDAINPFAKAVNKGDLGLTKPRGFPNSTWYPTTTFKPLVS